MSTGSLPGVSGLLWLALVHASTTWFLTGLIWFVQLVHYPLLAQVGASSQVDYHTLHSRITTRLVVPVMGLEGATSALLLALRPSTVPTLWLSLGMLLELVIWLSTAMIQVPAHRRLCRGFQTEDHQHLVQSNWLRTLAWSARGILALGILVHVSG